MKQTGIYGIFNLINKKVYIGSSGNKRGLKARLTRHRNELNKNCHHNSHLQRSWNKYGSNNFEFKILEECQVDMLIIREQAWMDYYKSNNEKYGYNLIGADRHIVSEETREKMRQKMTGRTFSQESLDKMSKSAIGNQKFLGKHHSKETREKMSLVQKGKIVSDDCKEKQRKAHLGKRHTEESKRKMSIALTGKIRSPEHCKKISENKKLWWARRKQCQLLV